MCWGISLKGLLWRSRTPGRLLTWYSHSCAQTSNMVVQSDATHTANFLFHWHATSLLQNSAVSLHSTPITHQANLRLQVHYLNLLLAGFWVFSTHSQGSCGQGILSCLRDKNSLNICLSRNSADHKGWMTLNLASGVHLSIQAILAARDLRIHQPRTQFLLLRLLMFSFFHVPSVMFLSPQSSSITHSH